MAGAKTEVTEVVVVSSAQVGTVVSVQVKIENTTDETLTIMAGGALEYGITPYPPVNFPNGEVEVAAGETQSFTGSFVMPGSDVIVHGYSYYYDEGEEVWYFDDEATNGVTATAVVSILDQLLPLMIVVMMMGMMMKVID